MKLDRFSIVRCVWEWSGERGPLGNMIDILAGGCFSWSFSQATVFIMEFLGADGIYSWASRDGFPQNDALSGYVFRAFPSAIYLSCNTSKILGSGAKPQAVHFSPTNSAEDPKILRK